MYVPSHFAMTEDDVRDLLAEHGAGDLVTFSADEGLVATLLPFVHEPAADGWGSLHGHVARVNAQWQRDVTGEALVILRGPDAYVSPGWYPSKQEHGRVVPTWNYVSAHVYGELVVHDDAGYTRRVVEALTAKHEAGSAHPGRSTARPPGSSMDSCARWSASSCGSHASRPRPRPARTGHPPMPPGSSMGFVDAARPRWPMRWRSTSVGPLRRVTEALESLVQHPRAIRRGYEGSPREPPLELPSRQPAHRACGIRTSSL